MKIGGCALLLALLFLARVAGAATDSATNQTRVEAALSNIESLDRPGQDGLALVWDGNKYVQCRHMADHTLRCEAGGALLQPSLAHILTQARIEQLTKLGWQLDPSFGNYVQVFPAATQASQVAAKILQALKEGYASDLTDLGVRSDWIKSQPCPPRNGPTQNLAGVINDAPSMAATSIRGCAYTKPASPSIQSASDLVGVYGTRVAGEIQRLRINIDRRVFVIFDTTGGYIQCETETQPNAIYCEAQSADSWPMLSAVLTPERVARLHAVGYADPGRAPNYSKTYLLGKFDDKAIGNELLTILYQVYGYHGAPTLKIKTEKGPA
jgi:hypothetical protein